MSYLVFARKWRPLNFDDIVGQEHITGTLKRAIEKDRVAHSYIFSGTRGVGKTTTARILARALNCDKGPTEDPCGVCQSCLSVIKGNSFDVLEIDGASNNGVDHIRELRDNIGYSSMSGKYRIFVIDEVHMLTKGAFNALLKTLEEPPRNVIFIFATTEPQKIPDTIHSRCQRYDFRRISADQIVCQLEKICKNENIAFDAASLQIIANKADGSMRDALSLLDQVFSFCTEGINESEVRSVLGLVDNETYRKIMDSISTKNPIPVIQIVEDVLTQGFDLSEFLIGFQEYIRKLLLKKINNTGNTQKNNGPSIGNNQENLSETDLSIGDILRISEIIRNAENDLKWSSFPRFLVETTLLKLIYIDSTISIETIINSIKRVKNTESAVINTGNENIKKKNSPTTFKNMKVNEKKEGGASKIIISNPGDLGSDSQDTKIDVSDPRQIEVNWSLFVESIIKEKTNLGTFLSLGYFNKVTVDSIDFRFGKEYSFQYSEINKKHNKNYIHSKLSSFFGRDIDLHISLDNEIFKSEDEENGKENNSVRLNSSISDISEDMIKEPIIKNLLETFNGELL
ncbi:MAG: DNA polymerase III subunit gamma/tau [Chitinispirillia bacterium]|jgi:DNA polymerase-3 subunit gamma/tau